MRKDLFKTSLFIVLTLIFWYSLVLTLRIIAVEHVAVGFFSIFFLITFFGSYYIILCVVINRTNNIKITGALYAISVPLIHLVHGIFERHNNISEKVVYLSIIFLLFVIPGLIIYFYLIKRKTVKEIK